MSAIYKGALTVSKQQKKRSKYDHAKLLDRGILQSFDATCTVDGKFHALAELNEHDDIDREWDLFSSSINEAAKEHLGYQKPKKDDWISSPGAIHIRPGTVWLHHNPVTWLQRGNQLKPSTENSTGKLEI